MKFPSFRKRDADTDSPDDARHIDGERSMPSVNKGMSVQAKITNWLLFAFVILIALIMLWRYYAGIIERHNAAQDAAKHDAASTQMTNLPPLTPPALPTTAAGASSGAPAAPPNGAQTANGQQLGPDGKPILSPAEQLQQRRFKSPIFFAVARAGSGGAAGAAGAALSNVAAGAAGGNGSGGLVGGGNDSFSRSLQGTKTDTAYATMMAHPSMTVSMTEPIPCAIEPALDSSLPGIVSCIQQKDVYSADGKVLLIERGTKWSGQQKSALAQGMDREGIIWVRGETPNHVLIEPDSGSADELGRPGVQGEVDSHFWKRFGSAFIFSFLSDASQYAIAKQSNSGGGSNNTTIGFGQTIGGSTDVVDTILKHDIDIPDVLKKNQGGVINILLARDLDLSSVYELQVKQ